VSELGSPVRVPGDFPELRQRRGDTTLRFAPVRTACIPWLLNVAASAPILREGTAASITIGPSSVLKPLLIFTL